MVARKPKDLKGVTPQLRDRTSPCQKIAVMREFAPFLVKELDEVLR